jgi:hypothetical protein
MTKEQKELARKMIEGSRSFNLGQVAFDVKGENENFNINVWTPNNNSDAFHATELIPALEHYFSVYITYNAKKRRCELCVF